MTDIVRAIKARGLVRISERNGWAKGVVGLALGYRELYGNVKVGLIGSEGEYTGEYTMVPVAHVEAL